MPTKRIGDAPTGVSWTASGKKIERACVDRDHDPPVLTLTKPGVYEHTCPSCGKKTEFTVQPSFWMEVR